MLCKSILSVHTHKDEGGNSETNCGMEQNYSSVRPRRRLQDTLPVLGVARPFAGGGCGRRTTEDWSDFDGVGSRTSVKQEQNRSVPSYPIECSPIPRCSLCGE